MQPPPFLQIIPQRHAGDCSVACLAMLCNVPYEQALMAFKKCVGEDGASYGQIKSAAKRLGYTLIRSRKLENLEERIGILMVGSDEWVHDHLVILKEGQIVDTDSSLWDWDVFLATKKVHAMELFELKEEKA